MGPDKPTRAGPLQADQIWQAVSNAAEDLGVTEGEERKPEPSHPITAEDPRLVCFKYIS